MENISTLAKCVWTSGKVTQVYLYMLSQICSMNISLTMSKMLFFFAKTGTIYMGGIVGIQPK